MRAFGTDIRHVKEDSTLQLPLDTKRPVLHIGQVTVARIGAETRRPLSQRVGGGGKWWWSEVLRRPAIGEYHVIARLAWNRPRYQPLVSGAVVGINRIRGAESQFREASALDALGATRRVQ